MEKKCANWYRNFKPPPESKVYYPTEEEFSDPITYVEKIREEGEKYGVIKVSTLLVKMVFTKCLI